MGCTRGGEAVRVNFSLEENDKGRWDYGGFGDEQLLPVDGKKALCNGGMETEGEAHRGREVWLPNPAPSLLSRNLGSCIDGCINISQKGKEEEWRGYSGA